MLILLYTILVDRTALILLNVILINEYQHTRLMDFIKSKTSCMMEKEESKCRGRVNVEFRKDRWDVVDGDEWRQKLVATQRQRLGEIVGHVDAAGNVPHAKLSLPLTVLKPMPPHAARFGELGFDGFVGEPDRHLIVAMDDGGG